MFLEKVTAFITREHEGTTELLLFRHPHAGIQLPAGTVEEGERHADAALREAWEESGLKGLQLRRYIGMHEIELPPDRYAVITTTPVYARPDRDSFDWATLRRGFWVEHERSEDEFTQIAFREYDRWPDPQYVTYCIQGWVPNTVLSRYQRRYFYHMHFTGISEDQWEVAIDNHIFHLFWASLKDLPQLVEPQQQWLEFVCGQLHYRFSEKGEG